MQSRKPNAQGQKLVSGRELYEVLGIKTQFTIWIKRMIEYGFVENVDYTAINQKRLTAQGNATEFTDYILTLEMAKHIAMVQRTEIGMQVRNYFLECEKYGFQENVDYTLLAKNSVNPKGGSPQSDYLLVKYPHV